MDSFSIGGADIVRIEETQVHFDGREFFPELSEQVLQEHAPWLAPFFDIPGFRMPCVFQSFVIRYGKLNVLVDTCIGNDKERPDFLLAHRLSTPYLARLHAAGYKPEDIDIGLCTHMHVDHVGWNTRLVDGRWVPTFPNARYVFGARELDATLALHRQKENLAYLDSVLPVIEAGRADIVADDFQLGDHVRILPTPGHTDGHVSFCFGRQRDDVVMTGDLIHVPLQMRYPEFSFARDKDPVQAATTRRAFLERYCDTSTLCCTAHFPSPSAGRITRWGDGYRLKHTD